jgi:hypothetical protein
MMAGDELFKLVLEFAQDPGGIHGGHTVKYLWKGGVSFHKDSVNPVYAFSTPEPGMQHVQLSYNSRQENI